MEIQEQFRRVTSHLTRWRLHFFLTLRNATAYAYDCSTAFPQDSDGSPSLLGFFLVPWRSSSHLWPAHLNH